MANRRLKLSMAAASALTALAAGAPGAGAVTLKPTADAYVTAAQPGANFGGSNSLRADGSPIERSYVRFKVEGLLSPVSRATLRLYSRRATGTGVRVRGVSSDGWGERTITYSNAPAVDPASTVSPPLEADSWVAIDVTSLVSGNGTVSIALTAPSSNGKRFSSRELAATSPELEVLTEPVAGDPVIAAAGDVACSPADPRYHAGDGTAFACRQKYTSEMLVGANLAAVLPLGDLQYEDGLLPDFQQVFDPTWGRVKSLMRPVPGNHEYQSADATGYYDYFNGVGVPSGSAGHRDEGWYSYDIGSWHLVALNSECDNAGGCGAGSPQVTWLKADLAAHPATCTLAHWHEPLFSSGFHGGNGDMTAIWRTLSDAGVDVALTAHDHDYERFAAQDENGVPDPAGMREFVVGTGGSEHRGILAPTANSGVHNSDTFGLLTLTLHDGGYDWEFVPEAGEGFTDSGSDVCDGAFADSGPPTAPTRLAAAPLADDQVSLTWSPSSDDDGVAGYRVLRDGKPIGTSTSRTFTDETADADTTYRYEVVAFDPARNSSSPSEAATVMTPRAGRLLAFTPTDDAFVAAAMPATNFGVDPVLWGDSGPDRTSLLRFSISGIGSRQILGAKLRLYVTDPSTSGGTFSRAENSAWRQEDVTWDNAPAAGSALGSLGRVTAGRWFQTDVTGLVAGDGPVSVLLSTSSADGVSYASKENAAGFAPQLLVRLAKTPVEPPPPAPQPTFPIRAAFYYPWFPEAWNQQGINPFTKYQPSLGLYDSGEQALQRAHLQALEYGNFDAGIYSWWGQGHKTDLRLPGMLAQTNAAGSPIKWAIYHEREGNGSDPTVEQIGSDLDYVKANYAGNPAYLTVGGRPVIFVYGNAADTCATADRWEQANTPERDFYVVLKTVPGYRTCASQPDAWHQYVPSKRTDHQPGNAFAISPEFDLTGPEPPRLPRDLTDFERAVDEMVASNEPWQLVTTFNEWGENSAVESSEQWPSASGYGRYLDALAAQP